MRPMVHTEKHINQFSLFTVASGAIVVLNIAKGEATPLATDPADVREGCTIASVFVELWITTDDATAGSSIVTIEKRVSGLGSMAAGDSAALNVYDNKKNVFHTQMGLTPGNTQYPMATIKGWFKIPKGKQRFGLGDKLVINVHGQSNGLNGCGFVVFKEQY